MNAVITALEQVPGIAGRFQTVEGSKEFSVIIDYAHTPDGLENVISTAQAFAKGRVIHRIWLRWRPGSHKTAFNGRSSGRVE